MASHPKGSNQLRQQQSRPHHYKSTTEIHREADRLLEQLAEKLARDKNITKEEAREELRHWM